MHILFFTDNFPPEVNAPASRTFEHAREWVRAGHKVTVITCAPNFPQGKVFEGYRNRLHSRETMDGIDVVRVWTYISANQGFFKRTLDYASFCLSAIPAGLLVKGVDVMVATSPQLFAPCAAHVVSVLKCRPYVFELRDLWPESIRAVAAMKNSVMLDWLEKLELFLYRKAKRIVAVTHAFKDNLVSRGVPAGKIGIVMNGADLSRFAPLPRDEALAGELGLTGKIVVGYVGTHGMAHHLQTVLEAASAIQNKRGAEQIHFLFLGDGAEKENLRQTAHTLGLKNVTFLDSVPRPQVPAYWSLIDISVIHLRDTELFTTVIPSKLFECMAMGIPVLHGVRGESAAIVEREGAGICFPPEDAAALAGLIEKLTDDPVLRQAIRHRALEASARYDRKAMAADMLGMLVDAAGTAVAERGVFTPATANTAPEKAAADANGLRGLP